MWPVSKDETCVSICFNIFFRSFVNVSVSNSSFLCMFIILSAGFIHSDFEPSKRPGIPDECYNGIRMASKKPLCFK